MKKLLTAIFLLASTSVSAQSAYKPIVAILGDSYSTFEGYIPAGHPAWYSGQTWDRTDVTDVKQTWWWQVVSEGGFRLGINDSYSGSTISYTGYNDEDYTDRSFITRVGRLGNPDIILIFGGTNDSWTGGPVGEYTWADFKRADLFCYRPALAFLLQSARERYPNVNLYFIVNDELKDEITESTRIVCEHYDVERIELRGIEKQAGHPNVAGMHSIARQVLAAIKK